MMNNVTNRVSSILVAFAIFSIFILVTPKIIGFNLLHYGVNSAHGLVLAKSAVDQPALFLNSGIREVNGKRQYLNPYNRWPVPVFYLTGLIVDVTSISIEKQVMAARYLMSFFFVIACVFMMMALRETGVSFSSAMSAVILTTSSATYLGYLGVLFNTLPSLAGCAIVAWLIAAQSNGNLGRYKAYLLSIGAASLGWEPVAFFVTWFLLSAPYLAVKSGRERFRIAFFSCVVAAMTVILFLFGQLWYEAHHLGIPEFLDTPSAQSIIGRAGIGNNNYEHIDEYSRFYLHLIARLDALLIPFTEITGFTVHSLSEQARNIFAPIVLSAGILLICLKRTARAPVIVGLSLAPFLWYIPMKDHSFAHDFQSMFFLTTVSFAWAGYLCMVREGISRYLLVFLVAIMVVNGFLFKGPAETDDERFAAWTRDVDRIREVLPLGERVAYVGPARLPDMKAATVDLYLYDWVRIAPENAVFIISTQESVPGYQKKSDQVHLNLFRRLE